MQDVLHIHRYIFQWYYSRLNAACAQSVYGVHRLNAGRFPTHAQVHTLIVLVTSVNIFS